MSTKSIAPVKTVRTKKVLLLAFCILFTSSAAWAGCTGSKCSSGSNPGEQTTTQKQKEIRYTTPAEKKARADAKKAKANQKSSTKGEALNGIDLSKPENSRFLHNNNNNNNESNSKTKTTPNERNQF